MRHTLAVLAAAGLLIGTIATGTEARHGKMGGIPPLARSVWRPHHWWRRPNGADLQSLRWLHCDAVDRDARLAGEPWISVPLDPLWREKHKGHPVSEVPSAFFRTTAVVWLPSKPARDTQSI